MQNISFLCVAVNQKGYNFQHFIKNTKAGSNIANKNYGSTKTDLTQ
jgi:hypothetical protein